MTGHALRDMFITRDELIEELRNLGAVLPECIIQYKRSNEYLLDDWDQVVAMTNTRTICACYEGVGAKIPFKPGVSPYTLGCIFCDDPNQYPGYLAETNISWCGDRGLPDSLRVEVEKSFLELKKRLRKRCKPYVWRTTEGDITRKYYISTSAFQELKAGKKFCQACGPGRIEPDVFYVETESGRVTIY